MATEKNTVYGGKFDGNTLNDMTGDEVNQYLINKLSSSGMTGLQAIHVTVSNAERPGILLPNYDLTTTGTRRPAIVSYNITPNDVISSNPAYTIMFVKSTGENQWEASPSLNIQSAFEGKYRQSKSSTPTDTKNFAAYSNTTMAFRKEVDTDIYGYVNFFYVHTLPTTGYTIGGCGTRFDKANKDDISELYKACSTMVFPVHSVKHDTVLQSIFTMHSEGGTGLYGILVDDIDEEGNKVFVSRTYANEILPKNSDTTVFNLYKLAYSEYYYDDVYGCNVSNTRFASTLDVFGCPNWYIPFFYNGKYYHVVPSSSAGSLDHLAFKQTW